MVNPQIKDYIQKHIKKYSVEEIRSQLIAANYPLNEINSALVDVETLELNSERQSGKKKSTQFLVMFGVSLIAVISIFLVSQYSDTPDCYPGTYNENLDSCVFDIDSMANSDLVNLLSDNSFVECPAGSVYNNITQFCEVPTTAVFCEQGNYNLDTNLCEYRPDLSIMCSEGEYNETTGTCDILLDEVTNTCLVGDYNEDKGVCEKSISLTDYDCDRGSYNVDSGNCEYEGNLEIICSDGTYNSDSNVCEYEPELSAFCSIGNYNSETETCEYEATLEGTCTVGNYNNKLYSI